MNPQEVQQGLPRYADADTRTQYYRVWTQSDVTDAEWFGRAERRQNGRMECRRVMTHGLGTGHKRRCVEEKDEYGARDNATRVIVHPASEALQNSDHYSGTQNSFSVDYPIIASMYRQTLTEPEVSASHIYVYREDHPRRGNERLRC
jgi:hypothetical protein